MLGQALGRVLGRDAVLVGRDQCDVRDMRMVGDVFKQVRPDVVVHAAAWTDVDGCEEDEARARSINMTGTQNVAMAAAAGDVRLIVISTDYVFPGDGDRPLTEDDRTGPRSAYGRTKLAGEGAAIFHHPSALIIRTAGSYGPGGRHFPAAVARRVASGEPLSVVNDQFVSPTYVDDLAAAIARLVNREGVAGVYHCANSGVVSWYDFAREILSALGRPEHPLNAVSSAELARVAPRPAFSALDSTRIQRELGIIVRTWDAALQAFVSDCGGSIA